MRLLLDTHALIWWWMDDPSLPATTRTAMLDTTNQIFVSAASAWEIATKVRKGQLSELRDSIGAFASLLSRDGFQSLDVTTEHGLRGGSLRGDHKDPFDRLIAAQALIEDMVVVTRDRAIAAFGCEVIW